MSLGWPENYPSDELYRDLPEVQIVHSELLYEVSRDEVEGLKELIDDMGKELILLREQAQRLTLENDELRQLLTEAKETAEESRSIVDFVKTKYRNSKPVASCRCATCSLVRRLWPERIARE